MKSAVVAMVLGLVAMVTASAYDLDPEVYNDLLVQDLYKRLALIEEPELRAPIMQDYYYEEGEPYQMPKNNWMAGNAIENPELRDDSVNAAIRDQEYIEHSSQGDGFQYISGGAGEGEQHLTPEGSQDNTQEVKTDEHLPFYCHPPNPCPKGFEAKDGCQDFVDDSAEFQRKWIWKMQQEGMCACDEEHMFHCPKDDNTINTEKGNVEKDDLDKVLSMWAAKPKSIDDIDAALEKMKMTQKRDHNPFLGGYKLSRAAKKGMGYQ
jgi:hypothetical protein